LQEKSGRRSLLPCNSALARDPGKVPLVIELIGWGSSLILLLTLMRQVFTQWRTRATAGVSKWLFVGQLAASTGYVVYSYLLHNWVYVTSNIAILATALVGEGIYMRNRALAKRGEGGAASAPSSTAA
jgi:uncharacterized protein with PQ loop repeat